MLKEVIEGRMEGKRIRGRPKLGMLDDLITHSYVDMKIKQRIEKSGVIRHEPATRQHTKREREMFILNVPIACTST